MIMQNVKISDIKSYFMRYRNRVKGMSGVVSEGGCMRAGNIGLSMGPIIRIRRMGWGTDPAMISSWSS
jgi:hypothetical protein